VINARRLRYAGFSTPNVARQVEYFRSVIGLAVVGEESGRVWMATENGQIAIVFENGAAPGLTALALELSPDLDLNAIQRGLSAEGVRSDLISDPAPGSSSALRLTDIEGRWLELFSGPAFQPNRDQNPGVSPIKLGHIACYTRDPDAISKYYGKLLGFRISDWIEDRFVFMRCGSEHHTMNFALGAEVRVHHMAFQLRDAGHMHRACDILGAHKVRVLWGPVRHGPGHNVAIYHREPDGHVVEMFYDLDVMTDEELGYYDPRPWHRDRPQRPKVWVGLPRDVWGGPPVPELPEFYRLRPPA
jgi:catechol-2,3-dioxygenase